MDAHTQQRRQRSVDGAGPGSARPPVLRWLVGGAATGVALLVGLPLAMVLDREATLESIRRDTPGLDPAGLEFAFTAAIVYTVVLHAVDVVLLVWFTAKVVAGRRWARIALTVYLVLASLLGLISATEGAQYLWVVVVTDLVYVVMLGLLWLAPSVRGFLARPDGPRR